MDDAQLNAIIDAVVKELIAAQAVAPARPAEPVAASSPAPAPQPAAPATPPGGLAIDLPDPALPEHRYQPRVQRAKNPDALPALIAATTARVGVGRAGPRYRTASLLLFQADHAITQDALYRDV
ncbi:MAG: ethanolamine ammonia-lyase light chain EutC, partial [Chloroflexi bacterium]|nr:ethanolamine ammonia-lyase light chain EutC [Chloroflexota bacterium]